MSTPSVSIFTPTYNRAHVLGRAYRSLLSQTCLDFEWVIADDGSTDDTAEQVAQWQQTAPFPIRYYQFPHRGKPYAMRDGFQKCEGQYLYELDSDDEMTPTAVERGLAIWASLPHPEQYHDVNGWGWIPEKDEPTAPDFPPDINQMSTAKQRSVNRRLAKGHCGEQRSFRVTRHCKEYSFPIPEGLTFIPENILWDRIYCDYKRWYTNEHFMVYHWAEQPDSLLKTVRDARPAYCYYIYHFNEIFPRDAATTVRDRMVSAASLCFAALRCGYPLRRIRGDLHRRGDYLLCALAWLPMMCLHKIKT